MRLEAKEVAVKAGRSCLNIVSELIGKKFGVEQSVKE